MAVRDRIESLPRAFKRDGSAPLDGEDPDVVLEVLSVERRREAIRALDSHGALRFAELAELVAVACSDADSRATLDREQRKRVYIGLYQTHIPKLDDVGATDWHRSDPVSPGPKLPGYAAALRTNDRMMGVTA